MASPQAGQKNKSAVELDLAVEDHLLRSGFAMKGGILKAVRQRAGFAWVGDSVLEQALWRLKLAGKVVQEAQTGQWKIPGEGDRKAATALRPVPKEEIERMEREANEKLRKAPPPPPDGSAEAMHQAVERLDRDPAFSSTATSSPTTAPPVEEEWLTAGEVQALTKRHRMWPWQRDGIRSRKIRRPDGKGGPLITQFRKEDVVRVMNEQREADRPAPPAGPRKKEAAQKPTPAKESGKTPPPPAAAPQVAEPPPEPPPAPPSGLDPMVIAGVTALFDQAPIGVKTNISILFRSMKETYSRFPSPAGRDPWTQERIDCSLIIAGAVQEAIRGRSKCLDELVRHDQTISVLKDMFAAALDAPKKNGR